MPFILLSFFIMSKSTGSLKMEGKFFRRTELARQAWDAAGWLILLPCLRVHSLSHFTGLGYPALPDVLNFRVPAKWQRRQLCWTGKPNACVLALVLWPSRSVSQANKSFPSYLNEIVTWTDAKAITKSLVRINYIVSRYPTKILIITKRKILPLCWTNLQSHYLNQMITKHHQEGDIHSEGHKISPVTFLPPNIHLNLLNLIRRKHQRNLYWATLHKIHDLWNNCLFKTGNFIKDKDEQTTPD